MSKKMSTYLKRALVSSLTLLMVIYLGLRVRAFATAAATEFILATVFTICAVILIFYFEISRPTRDLTAPSQEQKSAGEIFPRAN